MKLKKILCAAAMAVLLLSGCASQQSRIEYIGEEKAKELALKESGLSASQVEFTAADLSERSGQNYYRVEFTAQGENCHYDIDALTGAVLDAKVPENDGSDNSDSGRDAAGGADTQDGMITDQEAKTRALAHAGLKEEEVTFVKCRLDHEDNGRVYEVEFYTGDHTEYDYDIDAFTGEVISYDHDAESDGQPSSDEDSMISEQKAKELALAQVPGAADSDIREFETDHDDGRIQYEGRIVYDGMEYEFEIDGYSGAFRSWEGEPLD